MWGVADWSVALSAWLMRFVDPLYMLMVLCGGAGVLPWGIALDCYGGDGSCWELC